MSDDGKTFGIRKDGTLGPCKAKPENQGTGRCYHDKHVSLTAADLKTDLVQRYNEEVLQKLYETKSLSKDSFPDTISADNIQSHSGGEILSRDELEVGAVKVAEKIRNTDWSFIKDFYQKYDRVMNDKERAEAFKKNPAENIRDYLESDDPTATKLRGFLGSGVNVKEFSEILVQQGGAMTASKMWHPNGGSSIKRAILTSLNNDMTKERYIASVVFFGGRCCYCNKTLRKDPPPERQASGEHITPVSPDDPKQPLGGTRYGNMALACVKCNGDRGNTELTQWISETSCIKPENKEKALGRIQAFREFALYREYSTEESSEINAAVNEVKDFVESHKSKSTPANYSAEFIMQVNNKIKIAVFDLQHGI